MAREPVDLELLLALDSSSSVSHFEFALQQRGLAAAFRDPAIHRAIEGLGDGGMVLAVVQWAGEGAQRDAFGWLRLRTAADALAAADRLEAIPRALRGFTDIAGALRYSTGQIEGNAYAGARKVIDISGDGTADGEPPDRARDAAIAAGIVVNGLVVHTNEYDLGDLAAIDLFQHYETQVTGGPASFVMEAADYRDFVRAIRLKLLREISGTTFAGAASAPFAERPVNR